MSRHVHLYLASFDRFGESVLKTRIKKAAEPIEGEVSDFKVLGVCL